MGREGRKREKKKVNEMRGKKEGKGERKRN